MMSCVSSLLGFADTVWNSRHHSRYGDMRPICPTDREADQGTVMTTGTVNKHGDEIITSTTSIYKTQTFKSQPNGEFKLFRLPNLNLRTNHIFVLIGRHQRDGLHYHSAQERAQEVRDHFRLEGPDSELPLRHESTWESSSEGNSLHLGAASMGYASVDSLARPATPARVP